MVLQGRSLMMMLNCQATVPSWSWQKAWCLRWVCPERRGGCTALQLFTSYTNSPLVGCCLSLLPTVRTHLHFQLRHVLTHPLVTMHSQLQLNNRVLHRVYNKGNITRVQMVVDVSEQPRTPKTLKPGESGVRPGCLPAMMLFQSQHMLCKDPAV